MCLHDCLTVCVCISGCTQPQVIYNPTINHTQGAVPCMLHCLLVLQVCLHGCLTVRVLERL
jgi:hypothetical protein